MYGDARRGRREASLTLYKDPGPRFMGLVGRMFSTRAIFQGPYQYPPMAVRAPRAERLLSDERSAVTARGGAVGRRENSPTATAPELHKPLRACERKKRRRVK